MSISQHNSVDVACYAPIGSLYFDILGRVTVCCLNREYPIGVYPRDRIHDIWFGTKVNILRREMRAGILNAEGCQNCAKNIKAKGRNNSMPSSFDFVGKHLPSEYPVTITFETSNACNYECIMCGGLWSSAIRKNRENLPPLKSVYGNNFVEELREFLPHAKRINFLGGEPFLSPVNYRILDTIAELNPNASIIITSNGSIMNGSIKSLFNKLPNLMINLSIDSLKKETYELIRKHGNFDNVKKNIDYLLSINRLHGFSVCPIIQNIYEIPDIINFCTDHGIHLNMNNVDAPLGGYINGIHDMVNQEYCSTRTHSVSAEHELEHKIPEVSLKSLPEKEKIEIRDFLLTSNCYSHGDHISYLIDFILQ